jgi:tetratricopeptide (TPR) repeat protein
MAGDIPTRADTGNPAHEGKIRDALDHFDAELRRRPEDPLVLNGRAIALINLGRFDEALACSRKAAALSPGEADAWITMGVALDNLGRSTEAADALERAVAIRPYHVYARALLGITYQKLDMKDSAEVQNRKLQEMVFPKEYAGFFFTLASFLLGFLLGGVISAESSPVALSVGAELIIIAFFCALCGLFWRSIRIEYEVSRPPVPASVVPADRGMSSAYIVIGIMIAAFCIGAIYGTDVWASFH